MSEEIKEQSEEERLSSTIDGLVVGASGDCPMCAWRSAISEPSTEVDKSLRIHIRSKHILTIASNLAETKESSEEDLASFNVQEFLGLEVTDSFDTWDVLNIPDSCKAQRKEGYGFRWVAQENIDRWKYQGAEFVYTDKQHNLNNSSEDGRVKTNEMTLMRLPPQLKARIDKKNRMLSGELPPARKEEIDNRRADRAQQAYDTVRRLGASKQQADNIAAAVEHGLEIGSIEITRG